MKPTLSFYTNIVSPYQLDFFEALSVHFHLKVIYFSKNESDRQWDLKEKNPNYESILLSNNELALIIQKHFSFFHFSWAIFKTVWYDKSSSVIVGGNYFIPNTIFVLLLSFIKQKKIYWFGEKLFPSNSRIKRLVKKILLQPLFSTCDAIFCIGQAAIDSYKSYGYKHECYLVPYNIDNNKFCREFLDETKLNLFKSELNPFDKQIVLTSGSLIYRKGMDVAIKAFMALPNDIRAQSELWILGDGPLRHLLEDLTNKNTNIRFMGFIDSIDVPYYFSLSKLFLFCSRYDGWGVVINEAISAGLPVVVSDSVSASELIEEDLGGYICKPEDIGSFAKAIELVISDEKLMQSMSNYNLQISHKWNSKNMALTIFNLLNKND
jgi:glycosyltransferase involved in cell wall biosynthesis